MGYGCRPNGLHTEGLLRFEMLQGVKSKGWTSQYPSMPPLDSLHHLQVSCDQETDGGGWIMYQRRVDGTLNFTRNWEAYKHMFGDHGDTTT